MLPTLTFETKCYSKDWEPIIRKGLLEKMIAECYYPFDQKTLFLNNFESYTGIKKLADKLVARGIIDSYYVVADHADEALRFFNIDKASFKGGYYYSIAELVSIYLCKTDYLLHFSSDSRMENKPGIPWIEKAIARMEEDESLLVANAVWDQCYGQAKEESFAEDEDWYYSYGFSDQCYLVKTDRVRQPIYNEVHPASARYPAYGGELFEKRVDSYMRNHDRKRITSKHISYNHNNFPERSRWSKLFSRIK